MIRNEHDIQHALAHLEIGAPAVEATMGEHRFGQLALDNFFVTLRQGHREALTEHQSSLGSVVGQEELHELDQHGIFGRFAGRMAVRESGLIATSFFKTSWPPKRSKSSRCSPDLRRSWWSCWPCRSIK